MVSLPWMSKEFFTEVIRQEDGKEFAVVTNFRADSALPPGNNYGSQVLRVRVDYRVGEEDQEINTMSLIIKAELNESTMKDMINEIQPEEPRFYNRFIVEAKKIGGAFFAPKSFHCPLPNLVILEDLKEQGFVMADRHKQLDFEHCRLYAVAAATFHAASFAVHKTHPDLVESIGKEKMFNNENKTTSLGLSNVIKGSLTHLNRKIKLNDRYKRHCPTLEKMTEHLWDMLAVAHRPSSVINTLNQGDPWITNMMFKYDIDGKVSDIKLLDFQALRYGSPVNDLVCFFWTSANREVRRSRFDDFCRVYVTSFNDKMAEYGCDERLSLDHVMDNVKTLAPMVIFTAVVFAPLFCNPEPVDFETILTKDIDDEAVVQIYGKYYDEDFCRDILPQILDEMESRGVFEYINGYEV